MTVAEATESDYAIAAALLKRISFANMLNRLRSQSRFNRKPRHAGPWGMRGYHQVYEGSVRPPFSQVLGRAVQERMIGAGVGPSS